MEIEGGGWELPGDGAGGDRVGTWGSPMVIFLNKQWWVRTRNGWRKTKEAWGVGFQFFKVAAGFGPCGAESVDGVNWIYG
jgi:hypothetical protein